MSDEEFEEGISDEEIEEEEVVENKNPEYELQRRESPVKSVEEWNLLLSSKEWQEKLKEELSVMKPYERRAKDSQIVSTSSFNSLHSGFCQFLLKNERIKQVKMKKLAKVFCSFDFFYYISPILAKKIPSISERSVHTWHNIVNYLTSLADPTEARPYFKVKQGPLNSKKSRRVFVTRWETLWHAVLTGKVNSRVSLKLIPFVSANVIPKLKEPFKTVDFYFKMFEKGDFHSIISLSAIFKLITVHNFEYPNFYEKVYSLIKPNLFYVNEKQRVLELLDSFLSSTHIPVYIVASFAKRLARSLLYSPVEAIEPTLGLIRNLMTRHSQVAQLIHREVPTTFPDGDPFNNEETNLSKTRALESSLWEIQLLQQHWNQDVRRRANFIDKPLQKMESFVRFRCDDELFCLNLARNFEGKESEEEKYKKLQDGEEEETKPDRNAKKPPRKGKFQPKHEEEIARSVSFNPSAPKGILDFTDGIIIDLPVIWTF